MSITVEVEPDVEQTLRELAHEEGLSVEGYIKREIERIAAPRKEPHLQLRDLRGLGKEIWQAVDAQEYVNQLRDEWDR